jgi:hypothetical protein
LLLVMKIQRFLTIQMQSDFTILHSQQAPPHSATQTTAAGHAPPHSDTDATAAGQTHLHSDTLQKPM